MPKDSRGRFVRIPPIPPIPKPGGDNVNFKPIALTDVPEVSKKTRESAYKSLIAEFIAADTPAAQVELNGKKIGALKAGLAKFAKAEGVEVRATDSAVYLVRKATA